MELYYVKDDVQGCIDFMNTIDEDTIAISEITKNTIVCPINQSIPEKYFKTIDCEIATATISGRAVGLAPGDFCITYKGDNVDEVRNIILGFVKDSSPTLLKIYHSMISFGLNVYVVSAPIKGGVEFSFYCGGEFHCNIEEFNESFKIRRGKCSIGAKKMAEYLSEYFNCKILKELGEDRLLMKNMRGNIKACMVSGNIFKTKRYKYEVKAPMVFDEENKCYCPSFSLTGLCGFTKSKIVNGNYYATITVDTIDNESVIKKLLEEKGKVEWLGQ